MYCTTCGMVMEDNQNCSQCQIRSTQFSSAQAIVLPNQVTASIARKTRTSANIWTVIGILQIVIGFFTLIIGYGVVLILIGIWNLVAGGNSRKLAHQIDACNNPQAGAMIVAAFDKSLTSHIVFIFINLFLGGVIGVIGNLYHTSLRSEVLSKRQMFGVM